MQKDKYKRVTKNQLELWLDSPVTHLYKQALCYESAKIKEAIGDGGFIDSHNNDKSMNLMHSALGESQGLFAAADFERILRRNGLIEEENEGGL